IEFTKPLLTGGDEAVAQETKDTTGWVLDQLLTLLNPFMPYITEELHAHLLGKGELGKDDWLQSRPWPVFDAAITDKAAQAEVNWVVRLITEIRSVRADMNVPAAAQIDMQLKGASAENKLRLEKYEGIVKRLARLSKAAAGEAEPPKGSLQMVIDEATIILPIADVVDLAQEKARLKKAIEKEQQQVEKIDKMLNNQGFLAKAPEEVVDEQKELKAVAESTIAKLAQALKQIEAA
ncbi:MAG: class I tRNA ligase family protein, partial [Alphaproteobacteria bacterium]|nr:class I tRNA ligase family protein [Alphaproteobacteria bacterium]